VAEEQLGALLLRRRELVGGHQFDRRARQDALSAMPALVQERAVDGVVVVDRRDQPGATCRERRRLAPTAAARILEEAERLLLRIHRATGRHGVVDRPWRLPSARRSPSSGKKVVDRVVEAQLASLDEQQARGRRDRPGHGGDAEDRVAFHRRAAEGLRADGFDDGVAA
jgi:hypothetical protein